MSKEEILVNLKNNYFFNDAEINDMIGEILEPKYFILEKLIIFNELKNIEYPNINNLSELDLFFKDILNKSYVNIFID